MKNLLINRALAAETKKLFTLLLAVAASIETLFAWDYERFPIGDLYYNLDATNQTAEVTSQNSNYPKWSTTITTANIPSSVEYNSVTYTVTSIGDDAFYGCTGLTSVTIPNSVTSIGSSAFSGCSGLTSIDVASDNSNYCSVDGVLFNKDKTTLIQYPGGKQGAYTIPNSVTSIGYAAFSGCSGLTSVTIPNSVTSIGAGAFNGCTGLTSVTIPNSVTSIGDGAFSGCTGLTSIEIPNSVTSIGRWAFYGCSGLTSIEIPNSVTSIGDYAFLGCSSLTSLKLSAMLEVNYDDIYSNCNMLITGSYFNGKLDSYYLQQGFEWLKNLISVEAPAWFFYVPETDWIYCPRHLQHVAVNNGELTESALVVINRSYKTLRTLDVSNVTNTKFADEAFKGYYNLTELKLPANLQKVGYMMVAGCKNLQSIDIPASVEEIEPSAFEDCRSIKTITFGENPSLIRIGNWAFYNCHELQNLEIPEGVTESLLWLYISEELELAGFGSINRRQRLCFLLQIAEDGGACSNAS